MNALEEENEQLVLQLQQAHHQIQNLQVKLAQSESQLQDTQPLLQTILNLQAELTSLKSSTKKLQAQNNVLLDLSENAKLLKDENDNLKKILHQKDLAIDSLTLQIKTSIAKFNDSFAKLPDSDVIKNLTSDIETAHCEIKHSHILNWLNYAVVAFCLVIVVSIGYQTYVARSDIHSIQTSVKNIQKGIYNSKGWSVIEGAQNNEWVFSQEHPALYQQWLEQHP